MAVVLEEALTCAQANEISNLSLINSLMQKLFSGILLLKQSLSRVSILWKWINMHALSNKDMFLEADAKLSDLLEKGHNLTTPQLRVLLTVRDYVRELRKNLEDKA